MFIVKEVVNTVNMMNTQRMQDNNEIKLNDAQKQAYVTFLNVRCIFMIFCHL